jgi:hypothetical protein
MPISGLAGEQRGNDFQQTACGGAKLLPNFAFKIGPFSLRGRGIFHFAR